MNILKKAIVTGANGFIGSYLVKELVENGVEVIAVIKSETSDTRSIDIEGVSIVCCDLSNMHNLNDKIKSRDIDTFFHFAWMGITGESRGDSYLQMMNAIYTADAIRSAKDIGCTKFVGAGSIMEKETIACVNAHGNKPGLGYNYGAGKFAAHCLSKTIAAEIGIDHVWAVITNAYGVGEISERFINTTIRRIISDQPLQFTTASQNYDFVYITDVARALFDIGMKGKPFCEYVIGSSVAKPLRMFIEELHNILAPESQISFGDVPYTGVNIQLNEFDTSRTQKDTGFVPRISFADGVKMTFEWLKNTLTA